MKRPITERGGWHDDMLQNEVIVYHDDVPQHDGTMYRFGVHSSTEEAAAATGSPADLTAIQRQA